MRLRRLSILFLVILFTILQCTAFNYIRIFEAKPDILLILIIFFSLNFGRIYGLGVGALCGLFSEATCGISSGLVVFTYSLGGLILGHTGRWFSCQRILGEICITFIFSFLIYSFLFSLFKSSNLNLPLFNTLASIILPASFYTAVVSPFIFQFLKTIFNIK